MSEGCENCAAVQAERDHAMASQAETWQYVCEISRALGISPDDGHPMDPVDRLIARAESAEADAAAARAELAKVRETDLAAVLRAHLPRDRYRDDGEVIGTYCTCGEWTGDYFADGEAGPFDDHLASALRAALGGAQEGES